MHWLGQFLHNWWATLGLGAILGRYFTRLEEPMIGFFLDSYDQKVWDVVKHPRLRNYAGGRVQNNWDRMMPHDNVPYTVTEISQQLKRREFAVSMSLRRLEKRGKVRETHEGWLV